MLAPGGLGTARNSFGMNRERGRILLEFPPPMTAMTSPLFLHPFPFSEDVDFTVQRHVRAAVVSDQDPIFSSRG